jgi:hypothetical protein
VDAQSAQRNAITTRRLKQKDKQMEHIGSEYIVILNDRHLRQGLIRDTNRSPRSGFATNSTDDFRRSLAHALHGLAARVDPTSCTLDLRAAPGSTVH